VGSGFFWEVIARQRIWGVELGGLAGA